MSSQEQHRTQHGNDSNATISGSRVARSASARPTRVVVAVVAVEATAAAAATVVVVATAVAAAVVDGETKSRYFLN